VKEEKIEELGYLGQRPAGAAQDDTSPAKKK
jgi:hypothetical protein